MSLAKTPAVLVYIITKNAPVIRSAQTIKPRIIESYYSTKIQSNSFFHYTTSSTARLAVMPGTTFNLFL